MSSSRRPRRTRLAAPPLAVLALATVSCVPEAVVEVATRVFPGGDVERTVRIEGRTGEGEVPDGRDWLDETLGVAFARPAAWTVNGPSAGVVEAVAYFADPSDVPPTLAHRLDGGRSVEDRETVRVDIDDLVVMTRWRFTETRGDPFGPADATRAVDAILDVAGEILRRELAADLGDGVDLSGVDRVLRGPLRLALLETVQVERRFAATPDAGGRLRALGAVLERAGLDPVPVEGDGFWGAQGAAVRDALASALASELSTPDRPVSPDELGFVRAGDDLGAWIESAVVRTYGSTEEIERELEPLFAAIQGGYGGAVRTRFRFRVRVELPGRLLRTNGTPDGPGVAWAYRGETLLTGDRVLQASSFEPDRERLRALGVDRAWSIEEALEIEDLLAHGEVGRGLRELVGRAVDEGGLDGIRDATDLPEALDAPARRLVALLDGTATGTSR